TKIVTAIQALQDLSTALPISRNVNSYGTQDTAAFGWTYPGVAESAFTTPATVPVGNHLLHFDANFQWPASDSAHEIWKIYAQTRPEGSETWSADIEIAQITLRKYKSGSEGHGYIWMDGVGGSVERNFAAADYRFYLKRTGGFALMTDFSIQIH
ncbi:hypothetical protein BVY04_01265, partial [bacterium M21]